MEDHKEVARLWRENLKTKGYAHAEEINGTLDVARTPRVWKRIFKALPASIRSASGRSALEVGVGGGKHLLMLAAQGWRSVGIDVSQEVLDRARDYIRLVKENTKQALAIDLVYADLFEYAPQEKFSLVYHFGVIEHFLDDAERLEFLRRMCGLALPGGFVVSVVPSGAHPLRAKVRAENLGGYDIPEVDYDPAKMLAEFRACGIEDTVVLPHNIFGYLLLMDDARGLRRAWYRVVYYAAQVVPLWMWPRKLATRHAYSFIGIGKVAG